MRYNESIKYHTLNKKTESIKKFIDVGHFSHVSKINTDTVKMDRHKRRDKRKDKLLNFNIKRGGFRIVESSHIDGDNTKSDPTISAWTDKFLAGEFDSSGIFEHPDDPLPEEQLKPDSKNIVLKSAVMPTVDVVDDDIDISEAIEERINEIDEKGTYSF